MATQENGSARLISLQALISIKKEGGLMKQLLIAITLMCAVLTITAWAIPTPQPQQWEYKFEYSMRESKANELGKEGWELVSISLTSGGSSVREYAFKRKKSD